VRWVDARSDDDAALARWGIAGRTRSQNRGRPLGASGVWAQVLAVSAGAAIGALLRWLAGLWLNAQWNGFPLGTLLVNCVGGFWSASRCVVHAQPERADAAARGHRLPRRLTTFSAYSVESLILLQRGMWGWRRPHAGPRRRCARLRRPGFAGLVPLAESASPDLEQLLI
jgi:CrcB protein